MSDILKAFLEQTYGSLEKAKDADKMADLNPNAKPEHDDAFIDTGDKDLEKKANDEAQKKFLEMMAKRKPMREVLNIHTTETNNKTESHPYFKNYDHSLEQHRGHKLGLIKIKDQKTGDVNEMFDNMFTDNSNLVE